ncbi:MAG: hypothetical protein KDE48_24485, partial [Anaerolineales bacterium]|nr:hypothetical protein [Anaerolineales bacterium]
YQPPVPNIFNGSLTNSIALLTPPGPNGLTPNLTLTYNSGIASGLSGNKQADTYGFGWQFNAHIDIIQSLKTCTQDDVCLVEHQESGVVYNKYTLAYQGRSYELVHNDGINHNGEAGRYSVRGQAGFYAEYCKLASGHIPSAACKAVDDNDGVPNNGAADDTVSQGFWLLKGADNSSFRLGYQSHSEREVYRTGSEVKNETLAWRIDRLSDRFGNVMTYTYQELTVDNGGVTGSYHALVNTFPSYLQTINYGNHEIQFEHEDIPDRQDDPGTLHWAIGWEFRRIKTIRIGSNGQLVRRYELAYDGQRYGQDNGVFFADSQSAKCAEYDYDLGFEPDNVNLLTEILEYDKNSQQRGIEPYRAFTYTFLETAEHNRPSPGNTITYCYPYMSSWDTFLGPADNGGSHNPTAVFSYQQQDHLDMHMPPGDGEMRAYAHLLQQQKMISGWGTDAPIQFEHYIYASPSYTAEPVREGPADGIAVLQGFAEVTVCSGHNAADCTRRQEVSFETRAFDGLEANLAGKESQRLIKTEAGVELLSTAKTWRLLQQVVIGAHVQSRHPVVTEEMIHDKRNGGNAVTRTTYGYDKYANQTAVRDYGARLGGAPWRTTETKYLYVDALATAPAVNSDWLVNLPWQVIRWQGDSGVGNDRILWSSYYWYDAWGVYDPNTYPPPDPTDGLLSHVSRLTCTQWATTTPSNQTCQAHAWQTPTVYNYGGSGGGGGDWWQLTKVTGPDGIWRTTTWLDDILVSRTDDSTGYVAYSYTDSSTPWLLSQVRHINNARTAYEYDSYGRLLRILSPNPATQWPTQLTQEYVYYDSANPFQIDAKTPDPDGTEMKVRTFYDGLGQPLQQYRWGQWGPAGYNNSYESDKNIIDIQYDALGRKICETEMLFNNDVGIDNFWSNLDCNWENPQAEAGFAQTRTSYDILDDVVLTEAPNGGVKTTTIQNRSHTVTDAEGATAVYTYDELGRLSAVNDALDHTTTYTYDLNDNLTGVTGPDNAQTSMAYNLLGQKTYMDDPDMGVWSYAYDLGGRLQRQTDAKNQRLCFFYDTAGRLDSLYQAGSGSGACTTPSGTLLADYTYHAAGEGTGQVATITTNGSDTDTFSYDFRQRVQVESRVINGRSYSRVFSYDNLDRVEIETLKQEGAVIEYITTDYAGQFGSSLDSTAVSQPIVDSLSYNGHQQLKTIDRGGTAPTTTFSYYDKNSTTDPFTYAQAKTKDRWLYQIEHGGVNQLPNYEYVDYDLVGNIEGVSTLHQSWTENQAFSYDALYRLDTGTATNGIANYNYAYNYDNGGNIMSRSGTGGTRTYSYNPARPHAVIGVDQTGTADDLVFSYDPNGNMYERYRDGVKTHHQGFDVQNRLQYVTTNNQRTDFYYDANGLRVLTIQPDGTEIYTPFPELEQEIRSGSLHVDIERYQTNHARLTWQHDSQFSSYTVWHSSKPYFIPGDPGSTAIGTVFAPNSAYVHTNALADNINGYYVVVGHGTTDVDSNTVGEFNFDLAAGTSRVPQTDKPTGTPEETTEKAPQETTTTTITRITYSIDGQMIGVRVSGHPNPVNNGLFYTYTDHLGSVTALSDANGSYVAGSLGLHRPFGSYRIEPTTNPDITDRGYTGHRENLSLDLTYMNARYHLSEIGRFASPDPIVPDLMNPQTLNRYSYVNNNPINFRDSTGFYADEAGATGGGCDSRCIAILAAIAGSGYAAQQTIENLQDSLSDPFGMSQSNNDSDRVVQENLKDLAGPASSPGGIDPDDFDPDDVPQQNKQSSKWQDYVEERYQGRVRDAFDGEPQVIKLKEDTIVYRHYDGRTGSAQTSYWYSPKTYVNPGNAQRYLALPENNSANTVSRYVIPKGTNVLYGRVSSQVGNEGFLPNTTGGGMQYYVPNPNVVRLFIP